MITIDNKTLQASTIVDKNFIKKTESNLIDNNNKKNYLKKKSEFVTMSQQQQQQEINNFMNDDRCGNAIPIKNLNVSESDDQGRNINYVQHKTAYTHQPYSTAVKDQERFIWEMRNHTQNTTPASTVLNSPDLQQEMQHQYQKLKQINVGCSPVGNNDNSPLQFNCENGLNDGDILIFDDIDDNNWNENNLIKKTNNYNDDNKYIEKMNNYYINNTNDGCVNTDNSKITKMIGGLPIADYEGSPRRFGNIHHDESFNISQQSTATANNKNFISSFFPKPGFPQRIVSDNNITSSTNILQNNDIENEKYANEEKLDLASGVINNDKLTTFDYLYEFSETRKVLEEFFKTQTNDDEENEKIIEKLSDDYNGSDVGSGFERDYRNQVENKTDSSYIGQRLAKIPNEEISVMNNSAQHQQDQHQQTYDNDIELFLESDSRGSSGDLGDTELDHNARRNSRNFTLSPETTDYDSNCGDLDSLSNDVNVGVPDFARLYTSMPVLEDGLSSGHASDTENNNPTIIVDRQINNDDNNKINSLYINKINTTNLSKNINNILEINNEILINNEENLIVINNDINIINDIVTDVNDHDNQHNLYSNDENYIELYSTTNAGQSTPPPPAPGTHRTSSINNDSTDVKEALKDIRDALQNTKALPVQQHDNRQTNDNIESPVSESPIWVPRNHNNSHESLNSEHQSKHLSNDDEEADTDLETDRLLGQQRIDDQGFYDDKNWHDRKIRDLTLSPASTSKTSPPTQLNKIYASTTIRHNICPNNTLTTTGTSASTTTTTCTETINNDLLPTSCITQIQKSPNGSIRSKKDDRRGKSRNKEGYLEPKVLIEGVLFRARYLGSTQLVCEGQPTKTTRMMQAEEAVSRIKAPEGETQPSTEVDLFISTEKIMVLNTDLKEIMMDHALRTISYIADIGDLVVLMARRRFVPQQQQQTQTNQQPDNNEELNPKQQNRTPKMICHVFESDEAQFIAQSIGQAFQVAYLEFLKANGIEDHNFVKEMDYQEVLNSQEIFGDELEIFAKKELQKEVVVPKTKGEILGVVIVESGWGSMLPTVVIANLLSTGAAARCGQLNIGDQIIAINGLSLVGLPLSTCQTYIRNTKTQTAVKFTVVPCPPVVEVKIKRPNTKYQLGFSVQNGVICSLLRGGIAERGGVRVGHRIIEINNQSVVAVPHEKIVNLLATSVGEILMKTMPTSMFRLLTGQENPVYI